MGRQALGAVLLALCCHGIAAADGGSAAGTALDDPEGEDLKVSRECAVVVLVGGGVFGAVAAATVAPLLLSVAGFGASGVAANSLAASWQSTMGGLIAKGSLFALLQSLAAGGLGTTYLVSASALGGATAVGMLRSVCASVDGRTRGSSMDAAVRTVVGAYERTKPLYDATSEAASRFLEDTGKPMYKATSEETSQFLEETGMPMYKAASQAASRLLEETGCKPYVDSTSEAASRFVEETGKPMYKATSDVTSQFLEETCKPFYKATSEAASQFLEETGKPMYKATSEAASRFVEETGKPMYKATSKAVSQFFEETGKPVFRSMNTQLDLMVSYWSGKK